MLQGVVTTTTSVTKTAFHVFLKKNGGQMGETENKCAANKSWEDETDQRFSVVILR